MADYIPAVRINDEERDEYNYNYNFNLSKIYRFNWLSFQYVEPDIHQYRNHNTLNLCKFVRAFVAILLWCCLGFEMFITITGCNRSLRHASQFNKIMIMLHRNIWVFRYVCIHLIGVYMFYKYPYKIEDEIREIYALYNEDEKEDAFIKIKTSERKSQDIAMMYVFVVILFPICQNIFTLFIERKYGFLQQCEKRWCVDCIDYAAIILTRIASFPFFINLIFLSYLQRNRVKSFIAKLDFQHDQQSLITESYVQLHKSIRKVSSDLHPYVASLFILLITWGALGAYSVIETLMNLKKMFGLPDYPIILADLVGSSVIFLCETIFLFLVLSLTLGKVAYNQKMIVPYILMLSCQEKERELFTVASRIEKLQLTHSVGYTLFRASLTELNTVWLTVLGPIIALLFKFLLTEHFSP